MAPEDPQKNAVMVYTTIGSEDTARDLAQTLLTERLIACANVFPVWSMFHWKGAVQSESELVMILKTDETRVPDLIRRIPEIHPYETPGVEVFPASHVHGPFGKWLKDETDASAAQAASRS